MLHRIIAAAQRTYLASGAIAMGTGNLSHYDKRSLLRDKGK